MGRFLKGQAVELYVGTSVDLARPLLSRETNCSLNFTVNTMDESSKADANPDWDRPAYDNTELSISADGNAYDAAEIKSLLKLMVTDEDLGFKVTAQLGTMTDTLYRVYTGTVEGSGENGGYFAQVITPTSLEIDMPADGLATVSMSFDCGSDFSIDEG